jgi:hypothetical protein
MLGAISPFLGHLQLPTPQHDDVALQRKKRSLDSHSLPLDPQQTDTAPRHNRRRGSGSGSLDSLGKGNLL